VGGRKRDAAPRSRRAALVVTQTIYATAPPLESVDDRSGEQRIFGRDLAVGPGQSRLIVSQRDSRSTTATDDETPSRIFRRLAACAERGPVVVVRRPSPPTDAAVYRSASSPIEAFDANAAALAATAGVPSFAPRPSFLDFEARTTPSRPRPRVAHRRGRRSTSMTTTVRLGVRPH